MCGTLRPGRGPLLRRGGIERDAGLRRVRRELIEPRGPAFNLIRFTTTLAGLPERMDVRVDCVVPVWLFAGRAAAQGQGGARSRVPRRPAIAAAAERSSLVALLSLALLGARCRRQRPDHRGLVRFLLGKARTPNPKERAHKRRDGAYHRRDDCDR